MNFFVQAEKKTSKKSKHFKNELLFTLYGDVLYKCERILAGSEQIAFQSNCGENASMKRGLIPLQKKKKENPRKLEEKQRAFPSRLGNNDAETRSWYTARLPLHRCQNASLVPSSKDA